MLTAVHTVDVGRELVICYCLPSLITIFFKRERESQNIYQLFLHVGASRADKRLLCQD